MKHYVSGTEEWLYMYDADDERAWSFKPGVAGTSVRFDRWTLRDLGGKALRTYEASGYNWTGSWAEDDIYRDGLLFAAETPTGPRHFHLDHLGTPRLITDGMGTQLAYHVYYPYGTEATAFNQGAERLKFTGHERDLASPGGPGDDLDYMHARHESPVTGRFLSVDTLAGSASLPQTWNRYLYAGDNPLRYLDPNGQEKEEPGLFQQLKQLFLGALNKMFPPAPVKVDPNAQALADDGEISQAQAVRMSPGAEPNLVQKGLIESSSTLAAGATYMGIQVGATKAFDTVVGLLRPGGQLLGEAGSSSRIRFLGGGKEAASQLFEALTAEGKLVLEKPGLRVFDVPGVGRFVYRLSSSTPGVEATIDVTIQGVKVDKLKFFKQLPYLTP